MKKEKPRVSLVFPVYGQGRLLLKALTTLKAVTRYPNYEVIVVDDCSKENMYGVYSKRDLYDKLILLPENSGNSTYVVNTGVKQSSGDFVQYQNSDVYFEDPEWLDKVMDAFDEETAVVGPAMLYPDKTVQSAGMFFDKRGLNRHLYRYKLYDAVDKRTIEVPMVTGCALTTRRDVYDKLGGFRVFRPYGWDDSDWCLKVRENGYRVKLCLESSVYHLGTVSYRGMDTPEYHRNRDIIMREHRELIEKDSRFKLDAKKYIFFLDDMHDRPKNKRLLRFIQESGLGKKTEILAVPLVSGKLKASFQKLGVRVFPPLFRKSRTFLKDYYNSYFFIEAERPDLVVYDTASSLAMLPIRLLSRATTDLNTYVRLEPFYGSHEAGWAGHKAAENGVKGKRILFVSHNLKMQGAPLSLYHLVKGFHNKGCDVEVLALGGGELMKRYEDIGVTVYTLRRQDKGALRIAGFAALMTWFFLKKKYDLIFLNTIATSFLLNTPTLDRDKCIWCIRESEREDWLGKPGIRGMVKNESLFTAPEKVLFVSESTRAVYEDLNKKDNFHVIHNGIDLDEIEAYKKTYTKDEIKRRSGLEGSRIFLNVGTINERKGQKYLVEAAINFLKAKKTGNYYFILVGGRQHGYEYEIRRAISDNDLFSRIIIVPEVTDVFKYYRMADCFVFTSLFESLPRTIMEAMAFELPIISTDVFGVVEEIEDGKSGILIKQKDPAALLEKLLYIDDNPDVAESLGREAYRRVREEFSLETMFRKYERLFDECLDKLEA